MGSFGLFSCPCVAHIRAQNLVSFNGLRRNQVISTSSYHNKSKSRQFRDVKLHVCGSIGFDLQGSAPHKSAEKHAEELARSASTLLLFQPVLKGKPGQAFLKVLLCLQKGNPNQLLEAFGELYSSLAAGGHATWQDYLLAEILYGKDISYAAKAAKGELPKGGPLDLAAAHDLDVLQNLSVAESTLVAWGKDIFNTIPSGWASAFAALGSPPAAGGGAPVFSDPIETPQGAVPPPFVGVPLSRSQRRQWRARIGGCFRWSEALPELRYCYAAHGVGKYSRHRFFEWTGTTLSALHPREEPEEGVDLPSFWADRYGVILTKSSLLDGERSNWRHSSIRVVELKKKHVDSASGLAVALAEQPRMKFAVVCENLEIYQSAKGHCWPDNALVLLM